MGICILSEIQLFCSYVPDTQIAPYIKKSNAAFSLELVIPITWVGYSLHLGEWELFCCHKLFWSAHFTKSAVS